MVRIGDSTFVTLNSAPEALTLRSEPQVHSARAMSFDHVSLCIAEHACCTWSVPEEWLRAVRQLDAPTASIQEESSPASSGGDDGT